MKTLKFTPDLCQKILEGSKTSTWRLFDDRNLSTGDHLVFCNKETGEEFGSAVIDTIKLTTLGNLNGEDWIGHERFESEDQMYQAYRTYYGDRVSPDSELKIISFTFTPTI